MGGDHTPGIWTFEGDRLHDDDSRIIWGYAPEMNGRRIMIGLALDFNRTDRDEEADANAYLFAAASHMYEALKRVMLDKDHHGNPALSSLAMAIAQDAIDDADGKLPPVRARKAGESA